MIEPAAPSPKLSATATAGGNTHTPERSPTPNSFAVFLGRGAEVDSGLPGRLAGKGTGNILPVPLPGTVSENAAQISSASTEAQILPEILDQAESGLSGEIVIRTPDAVLMAIQASGQTAATANPTSEHGLSAKVTLPTHTTPFAGVAVPTSAADVAGEERTSTTNGIEQLTEAARVKALETASKPVSSSRLPLQSGQTQAMTSGVDVSTPTSLRGISPESIQSARQITNAERVFHKVEELRKSLRPGAASFSTAAQFTDEPKMPGSSAAAMRSELPASEVLPTRAVELQPLLTTREIQPLATAGPQSALHVSPPPTGTYDFAALVDRLVEARDAAAPQSIRTSITHTDFGQVSLRFQYDDGGLTVSMKSADPGFIPAAQAAAAASQSPGSGENSSGSPRHDPHGQPQNGTASDQSHSDRHGAQSPGRGDEREPAQPASTFTGEDANRRDAREPAPKSRDGIYA